MTEANFENGTALCPRCKSAKHEVYRRQAAENGTVACLVRCLKCDNTFALTLDRYDKPLPPASEASGPDLPFGENA
jgi:hypothetical protein